MRNRPDLVFDIAKRASGKTGRMLQWMLEAPEDEHRILVAPFEREAMRVYRVAIEQELPLESWQFVSPWEVRRGSKAFLAVRRTRPGQIVLGLDEVNLQLQEHYEWTITRISATGVIDER